MSAATVSTESFKNRCFNVSNNKHPKCPPRMSDGRHFTDYRPQCYTNNLVQQNNDIHNSYQMRMFMTHNADELMQLNRKMACDKNCCGPCQAPYQVGTMMPEKQAPVSGATMVNTGEPMPCGPTQSQMPVVDAHTGNPLNCPSWSTSNTRNMPYNCCSPVSNLANTYPISKDGVIVSRLAVQGGGKPSVNAV